MHVGSVSHLGIVIFPTLLALSQTRKVAGGDFIRAAVCGYEVGASVGRALMDQETVRISGPRGSPGHWEQPWLEACYWDLPKTRA